MMNTQLQKARAIIAARDEEIEELRKDRDWWLEKRQKAEKAITDLPVHIANVDYYKAQCDALAAEVARLTAENAALRAQLEAAGGWQKCGYPDTPEEGENVVWSEADIATWPGQWVGHYNPRQADSFQGLWYLRLPAPPQE